MLASTLSLPLWAIPIINSLTPTLDPCSIKESSAGIKDSAPSKENLFGLQIFYVRTLQMKQPDLIYSKYESFY